MLQKSSSSLSPSSDSDLLPPVPSQKHSSSSQWAALGLAQARRVGRELTLASPRAAEGDAGLTPPSRPSHSSHSPSPARLSNTLPPHTQVARSELNVRLPRGECDTQTYTTICYTHIPVHLMLSLVFSPPHVQALSGDLLNTPPTQREERGTVAPPSPLAPAPFLPWCPNPLPRPWSKWWERSTPSGAGEFLWGTVQY